MIATPKRAADLLERLQRARGRAGIARRHAGQHRLEQRRDAEPEAKPGRAAAAAGTSSGQRVADAADRAAPATGHAAGQQQRAERPPGAAKRCRAGREQRDSQHADRERHRGEARLQRREAEAGLQEDRQHHEEARHAGEEDGGDSGAEQEVAIADQASRQQLRRARGALRGAAHSTNSSATGSEATIRAQAPGRPAEAAPLDQRKDQREDRKRRSMAMPTIVVRQVGMARRVAG